ncbi:MAG: hypothetical protein ABF759_12225 [Acetobacter malorum]|uniref:hypothetical protein n=1 Tax=Acetobacter malorum TaxID=178901 RepID=UPI0039E764C1
MPDDDIELGMLADFGTDQKGWAKAKEIALRGFVRCSDGRLYHKELCEIALDKFDLRLKSDEKREADRERLKAWRAKQKDGAKQANIETHPKTQDETNDETVSETSNETQNETRFVGGKRVESRDILPSLRSGPPEPVAEPDQPVDARTMLFREGKTLLHHMTGKSEAQCGALIGRWLKTCRDRCDLLLPIIREAAEHRPADVVSWIEGAVRHRASGGAPSRHERVAEAWAGVPDIEGV